MDRTKLFRSLLVLSLAVNIVGCSSNKIDLYEPDTTGEFERVTGNWKVPPGHKYGSVTIVCNVDDKGSVSNLRVKKSSGDAVADAAAIQAVRLSVPLKMRAAEVEFYFYPNSLNAAQGK